MSTNKHRGNSQNHKQPRKPKHSDSKETADHSAETKHEPKTETKEQNDKHCSPHEVIINIPQQQNQWTIGDIISLVTCVVTTAYFVVTALIFKSNNEAVKQAERSANAAVKSDSLIQHNFEIENKPFIEFIVNRTNPILPDKQVSIVCSYKNYGNYPAKIIESKMAILFTDDTPTFAKAMLHPDEEKNGSYIVKGEPDSMLFHSNGNVSDTLVNMFNSRHMSLFLAGYIKYKNLATGNNGYYQFMIKKSADFTNGFTYLLNENIDTLIY